VQGLGNCLPFLSPGPLWKTLLTFGRLLLWVTVLPRVFLSSAKNGVFKMDLSFPYHVDWLGIVEEGIPDLPDFGEHGLLVLDLETGDVLSNTCTSGAYEGSFSTRAVVKAFGGRLYWSGNPARIDRLDNVFGFSLSDSFELVQKTLDRLGLPRFRVGGSRAQSVRSDGLILGAGARYTRIDVTRNFSTGSAASASVFRSACYGSRIQGRSCKPSQTGGSWGRSQYRQLTIYEKGPELAAHTRKRAGMSPEDWAYREALAAWATDNGLIRVELRVGGEFLRQTGTALVGILDHESLESLATDYWSKLRVGATVDMRDVFIDALEQGFTPRRASVIRDVVMAWYMGQDVRQGRSLATLYRLRKDVAMVAGVDIFSEVSVTALTRVRREVVLSDPHVPAWYHLSHAA
jgi:hypothetical protein